MEFGRNEIAKRQACYFGNPYLNSHSEPEIDKSMHNVMLNLKEIGKQMA